MIFYAYFFCCLSQNNYLCTLIFSLLLNMRSHPTWVRGLKQLTEHKGDKNLKSHPTWVRGLKHLSMMRKMNSCSSHPTWVRGLKLKWQTLRIMYHPVAPYVGAWIETSSD